MFDETRGYRQFAHQKVTKKNVGPGSSNGKGTVLVDQPLRGAACHSTPGDSHGEVDAADADPGSEARLPQLRVVTWRRSLEYEASRIY